jgi:hypothetical protein
MNGVLHSEHVISRSGIRGFSTKVKRGHSLSCSSERWRCVSFNHLVVVRKRGFFCTNARRKAGVPTVNWAECTPAMHSIQFFCANFRQNCGRRSSKTRLFVACAQQHTANLFAKSVFLRGTSVALLFLVLCTWFFVLHQVPTTKHKVQSTKTE